MTVLMQNHTTEIMDLSIKMVYLEAIQNAVSQLMERVDEISANNWHIEHGVIYAVFIEIEKALRLIDFAFVSLYDRMDVKINSIKNNSVMITDMFEQCIN